MDINKLKRFAWLFFLFPWFAFAAKPTFLVTAVTKAPTTLYAGQTATAIYRITNNTHAALLANRLSHIPAGVRQVTSSGTCASTFNLPVGASCLLQLELTANLMQGAIHGGLLFVT